MTQQHFLPVLLLAIVSFSGCHSVGSSDSQSVQATRSSVQDTTPRKADESSSQLQPVDMAPGGSRPIAFQRAILTMESGTPIGKVTTGWLHIERETLKATPGEGTKQFVFIGREELRKAHYSMPGDENPLFEDDDTSKARYHLGAEITWLHLDLHYQPEWASVMVESSGSMRVNWQVFDSTDKKVVFRRTLETTVQKSARNDAGEAAIFGMFRNSLRQLLADPQFVEFMRPIGTPKQLPEPTTPSFTPPARAGGHPSVAADH